MIWQSSLQLWGIGMLRRLFEPYRLTGDELGLWMWIISTRPHPKGSVFDRILRMSRWWYISIVPNTVCLASAASNLLLPRPHAWHTLSALLCLTAVEVTVWSTDLTLKGRKSLLADMLVTIRNTSMTPLQFVRGMDAVHMEMTEHV